MTGIRTRRVSRKINLSPTATGHNKVKVGFPLGVGDDILKKAVFNNYGTRNIPERPFMDNAIRDNRKKYGRMMRRAATKITRGELTMTTVMQRIGIEAVGDIQEEIKNLKSPGNAESTKRIKDSSNPLIDTGEMRGSVTHKTYV